MAELLIYGPIGATWDGDGVTAKGVADTLGRLRPTESIRVRINSPGGDVFEGIAIHNLLAERSPQVTVDIDGAAMSAASFVALAGSKVRMAENALFMIHNPWTVAMGEASDFDAMSALLRKIKESILDTYLVRASASRSRLSAMMDETTYLNAEEAQRIGFVDEITGAGVGAAAAKAKVNRLANLLKPPEEAQEGRSESLAIKRARLQLLKTRLAVGDTKPAAPSLGRQRRQLELTKLKVG